MTFEDALLKWYVVYTRPKTEKKVAECIGEMGIETYLPTHKVTRQWSDRKKKIEVPLFPSYVFVKVSDNKRSTVLSIKDLVRFVSLDKKPVVVRDSEIITLKRVLCNDLDVRSEYYFQLGTKVKIVSGQFEGLEGVIVRKNDNNTRLLIRFESLVKAFSISVSSAFAEYSSVARS